jgi:hypothetical protein
VLRPEFRPPEVLSLSIATTHPLRRQFYLHGTLNTIAGGISPALTRYTMRSFFRWMFTNAICGGRSFDR